MTPLRLRTTTWLMAPPRVTMLQPARRSGRPAGRPPIAVFGRTLMLAVATAVFGFTTMAAAPRADQFRLAMAAVESPLLEDPAVLPQVAAEDLPGPLQRFDSGLFGSESLGPSMAFTTSGRGLISTAFALPAVQKPEWREEEFASVTAADGRTLVAGDLRIHLVGLDLPMPEQVCRTLDGRLEYCTARAATQLELLTRWKRVTCHYRLERAGEAIGRCRTGTSDLSERMIKSGYAWGAAGAQARG
jgi:endonuclease YncB( thermonuclease family)